MLEDVNFFDSDPILTAVLKREGATWAMRKAQAMGAFAGSAQTIEWAQMANRFGPELNSFDCHGQRIDEVRFHPAYHELMKAGIAYEVHSIAWTGDRPGGHLTHSALEFLLCQGEAGVCCPITMTYAAIPALRQQPEVAAAWEDACLSTHYDPRCLPVTEKSGATIGMAMTEKQGGSDVRATQTTARPMGRGGSGEDYLLTGHKWFCSAPMSDAFLTLAQTEKGLSCFLLPRWRPDGTRNPFYLQRLKDKLGNRSNASSEVEFLDSWAQMVGEEGRGIATIMTMVQHTRLDTASASAGLMRQAVVQAVHHCEHRKAFGKRLVEQPLMTNLLADLALESAAATVLVMRVAGAFDRAAGDRGERAFARLAVALAKFWVAKRLPHLTYESLECLGGSGYVEENMMPRLYREAPLNSIWEGSGNVICLDILRVLEKEPGAMEAYWAEVAPAKGGDRRFDEALQDLQQELGRKEEPQARARVLAERMALLLQAALLLRHHPGPLADAFCAGRLAGVGTGTYGTLPPDTDFEFVLQTARVTTGG
ncbi:MAG: acyl-CoA dehydrogenase family protein [Pseudomonadota bacterium]